MDLDDLFTIRNNFGTVSGATAWMGDAYADGTVYLFDLFAVANNLDLVSGAPARVPEPLSALLLALAALVVLARRK